MTTQYIVYEMVLAVSNRRLAGNQSYQSNTKHLWYFFAKMSVDTDQEGLKCYQFRDGAFETADWKVQGLSQTLHFDCSRVLVDWTSFS